MIRERLYRLSLAIPACAAIGGVAYPHFYDGPVVLYDPMVGYGCGAAVGLFPGLLGHQLIFSGRGLAAAKGSVAAFLALLAITAAYGPFIRAYSGSSVGVRNSVNGGRYMLLMFGTLPAITLGGIAGWLFLGSWSDDDAANSPTVSE